MLMILKPMASYIMMKFHISIDTFKVLRGEVLGKEKIALYNSWSVKMGLNTYENL